MIRLLPPDLLEGYVNNVLMRENAIEEDEQDTEVVEESKQAEIGFANLKLTP
jgi:hypothetical protein